MKCQKCNSQMEWQSGGDSSDFSYEFEEWMECTECGHKCDVPKENKL